jgi:hypothetical protein
MEPLLYWTKRVAFVFCDIYKINVTVKSELFWDIAQLRVVIPYRRFGTESLFIGFGKELPLYAS